MLGEVVREYSLPYPVAVDYRSRTVEEYRVDSYPDYYLIDRSGRLRYADIADVELERAVRELLAEEPPPSAAVERER